MGEYGGGDPPFQCGPMGNGSFGVDAGHQLVLNEGATLQAGSPEAEQQLRGGWRNKIAREVRFWHSYWPCTFTWPSACLLRMP